MNLFETVPNPCCNINYTSWSSGSSQQLLCILSTVPKSGIICLKSIEDQLCTYNGQHVPHMYNYMTPLIP